VVVVSTHDGVDNPFNGLLNDVRAGKRKGQTLTITFDDAIAAGLYERIAMTFAVKGRKILPKEDWIADIRQTYGEDAAEELDCIPARGSGAWLAFDQIERAEDPDAPVIRLSFPDSFAHLEDHIRRAEVSEWCEASLLPILETFDARTGFAVGGDFARISDLSVIWPLAELQDRSWRTPFTVEMRNVPYTEQEFVWKYLLSRLRRWKAAIDAAGNGGYLAERLVQAFGETRVQPVLTNSAWWLENGPPVKSRFEDGRITIPRDKDVAGDLRAVKVEKGVPTIPQARTKEKGDAGGQKGGAKRHADAAVALVMAGFAMRLGPAEAIDFTSSGSVLPTIARQHEDRGFGVMASELQIERF
jgi:phage FluMu gp28-like protein